MTKLGGSNNKGVIFKIKPNGSEFTKLLDFDGTNGGEPLGSLFLSGNVLFGLTSIGGSFDKGVVFSIKTDGTGFTKLHEFDGINGGNPHGTLMQMGDKFYGTAYSGGTKGGGVVFSISPNFIQATNITISNITPDEATISWNRGNGTACSVFVRQDNGTQTAPEENQTYTGNANFMTGSQIGASGWYCVYNGTGSEIDINGLGTNKSYQVAIYEYIVTGENIHYINTTGAGNPEDFATLKQTQEIIFEILTDKTFGDSDFDLSASASSGLPVVFSSDNESIAQILMVKYI
ncbi:MAG: hypothetical protein HC905_24155 [Bacteroidales bacterium]|nr:hypothetical protein [Bacteroidales bacterium]